MAHEMVLTIIHDALQMYLAVVHIISLDIESMINSNGLTIVRATTQL